ncbi:MAG TPA: hypothetical protein VGE45_01040 [Chloroflexia bacterium]|jgi:hypothetical protein
MISIERDGVHFKVKVSDPPLGHYSMQAATAEEAVNAVAHYYGLPHEDPCAACKRIAEEQESVDRKLAKSRR